MLIDLPMLIQQCAPNIAPSTMMAIIKTESNGQPHAINLNKGKKLLYQPKTKEQAIKWVEYLELHNYNFDVGIAQINSSNIKRYRYKARDMLDPCTNIKVAGYIITSNYVNALSTSSNQQVALRKMISAYNTGNHQSGFTNGYVQKVIKNAKQR